MVSLNIFRLSYYPAQQIPDLIVMSITTAIILLFTIAPCTLYLKYSKPAVRVRQPTLLILMMFCVLLWLFGGFVTYRLMRGYNIYFCYVMGIWCYHYGLFGAISLLIIRSFNLAVLRIDVAISSKSSRGCKTLLSFALGILLFLTQTILNILFTVTGTMRFESAADGCYLNNQAVPFRILLVLLWVICLIISSGGTLLARKELRESRFLFAGVVLMIICIFIVSVLTFFYIHFLPVVRILCATLPPLIFSLYFISTLAGKSIFKILTCNSKYFDEWLEKFQANSIQKMLEVHLLEEGYEDDSISLASEDGEDLKKLDEAQNLSDSLDIIDVYK